MENGRRSDSILIVGRVTFGNGAIGNILEFKPQQKQKKEISTMKKHHFAVVALLLFAVYLAGVKFPKPGAMILGKVGLA